MNGQTFLSVWVAKMKKNSDLKMKWKRNFAYGHPTEARL